MIKFHVVFVAKPLDRVVGAGIWFGDVIRRPREIAR
jgi:hypothetical protein